MKISIVDYGTANYLSIYRAIEKIGFTSQITSDPRIITSSDLIILPGVGAFQTAINSLKISGLFNLFQDLQHERYFLGICLGMQLLFETSYENGCCNGLGFLKGDVRSLSELSKSRKLPHIGWSDLILTSSHQPIRISESDKCYQMYFVHSYFCNPDDTSIITAKSNFYDMEYPSAINYENITAFQFHPEKSSINGLELLNCYFNSL